MTSRLKARAAAAVSAVLLGAATLAGCSSLPNLTTIPLPGGADIGSNPRTYTLRFDDVLDLVKQSAVKFDGVPVGRVDSIGIGPDGWSAMLKIKVKNNVNLSDKATFAVQQTNLLGEKFVEITDPAANASAPRQIESNVVPLDRTRTATDVEQVLGALSLLLNGGGLAQLKPIIDEVNTALGPNGGAAKKLLNQTATLISTLNRQKDDIVKALDGLDRLSQRTVVQTDQIKKILADLPAGMQVLEDERPDFVRLLQQVDRLGQVGTNVLNKSRDAMVADLKSLGPVLAELAVATPDIITAVPLLLTYPFPDTIVPSIHGNSANTFLAVDLRLLNDLETLGVGQGDPQYVPVGSGPQPKVDPSNPYINGNGPRKGLPTVTLLPISNASLSDGEPRGLPTVVTPRTVPAGYTVSQNLIDLTTPATGATS